MPRPKKTEDEDDSSPSEEDDSELEPGFKTIMNTLSAMLHKNQRKTGKGQPPSSERKVTKRKHDSEGKEDNGDADYEPDSPKKKKKTSAAPKKAKGKQSQKDKTPGKPHRDPNWSLDEMHALLMAANHLRPCLKGKFRHPAEGKKIRQLAEQELADYVNSVGGNGRYTYKVLNKLGYLVQDAKKRRRAIDKKYRSGSGAKKVRHKLSEEEMMALDYAGIVIVLGIPGLAAAPLKPGARRQKISYVYDPMRGNKPDYTVVDMDSNALYKVITDDMVTGEDSRVEADSDASDDDDDYVLSDSDEDEQESTSSKVHFKAARKTQKVLAPEPTRSSQKAENREQKRLKADDDGRDEEEGLCESDDPPEEELLNSTKDYGALNRDDLLRILKKQHRRKEHCDIRGGRPNNSNILGARGPKGKKTQVENPKSVDVNDKENITDNSILEKEIPENKTPQKLQKDAPLMVKQHKDQPYKPAPSAHAVQPKGNGLVEQVQNLTAIVETMKKEQEGHVSLFSTSTPHHARNSSSFSPILKLRSPLHSNGVNMLDKVVKSTEKRKGQPTQSTCRSPRSQNVKKTDFHNEEAENKMGKKEPARDQEGDIKLSSPPDSPLAKKLPGSSSPMFKICKNQPDIMGYLKPKSTTAKSMNVNSTPPKGVLNDGLDRGMDRASNDGMVCLDDGRLRRSAPDYDLALELKQICDIADAKDNLALNVRYACNMVGEAQTALASNTKQVCLLVSEAEEDLATKTAQVCADVCDAHKVVCSSTKAMCENVSKIQEDLATKTTQVQQKMVSHTQNISSTMLTIHDTMAHNTKNVVTQVTERTEELSALLLRGYTEIEGAQEKLRANTIETNEAISGSQEEVVSKLNQTQTALQEASDRLVERLITNQARLHSSYEKNAGKLVSTQQQLVTCTNRLADNVDRLMDRMIGAQEKMMDRIIKAQEKMVSSQERLAKAMVQFQERDASQSTEKRVELGSLAKDILGSDLEYTKKQAVAQAVSIVQSDSITHTIADMSRPCKMGDMPTKRKDGTEDEIKAWDNFQGAPHNSDIEVVVVDQLDLPEKRQCESEIVDDDTSRPCKMGDMPTKRKDGTEDEIEASDHFQGAPHNSDIGLAVVDQLDLPEKRHSESEIQGQDIVSQALNLTLFQHIQDNITNAADTNTQAVNEFIHEEEMRDLKVNVKLDTIFESDTESVSGTESVDSTVTVNINTNILSMQDSEKEARRSHRARKPKKLFKDM